MQAEDGESFSERRKSDGACVTLLAQLCLYKQISCDKDTKWVRSLSRKNVTKNSECDHTVQVDSVRLTGKN